MFTGIVMDIGVVETVSVGTNHTVRITPSRQQYGLEIGASIACDGVCLTVTKKCDDNRWFEVNVSKETLDRTVIGKWGKGRRVNLERSLRVGDELGGHIVSGHIDGVASIEQLVTVGESRRITCRAPKRLSQFIAEKGSIALNGVSLTVNEVTDTNFTVNLIPHTLAETTWGFASQGDSVNIEIDILARYITRFQEFAT